MAPNSYGSCLGCGYFSRADGSLFCEECLRRQTEDRPGGGVVWWRIVILAASCGILLWMLW